MFFDSDLRVENIFYSALLINNIGYPSWYQTQQISGNSKFLPQKSIFITQKYKW